VRLDRHASVAAQAPEDERLLALIDWMYPKDDKVKSQRDD
jgi:hypothetical protein